MKKTTTLFIAVLVSSIAFAQPTVDFTDVGTGLGFNTTSATSPYTVQVADNTSYSGDVIIPSTVMNGGITYAVTAIGEKAFAENANSGIVTIPGSVKTIGLRAFIRNLGMDQLNLSEGLESIGELAFFNLPLAITTLDLPSTVNSIDSRAFDQSKFTSVISRNPSLPTTHSSAFNNLASDGSITLIIPIGSKSAYNVAPWSTKFINPPTENATLSIDAFNSVSNLVYSSNPVSNSIEIKTKGAYSIVNISGQQVLSGTFDGIINVEELSNGIYILQIKEGIYKFIKN